MKQMKRMMAAALVAGGCLATVWPGRVAFGATLHFAGSSQLDDGGRKVRNYPYWSWGTELEKYMAPGHRVRNCAASGHSTKSFRDTGLWQKLLDGVRPGDFVGIQFGANDQKCHTDFYREKRWAPPFGLFRDIQREWVAQVRAKGATPILISHSGRCTFDKDGRHIRDWESAPGVTLGSYTESTRQLAKELGCDFVDMQTMVRQLSESLGRDEALKNYVISTGLVLGKDGEPTKDTTHPIKSGAEAQAKLFLDDARRQGLSVLRLFERPERVLSGKTKLDVLRLDGGVPVRLEKGAVVDCNAVVAEQATNVFLTGEGEIRLAQNGSVTIRDCQGVRIRGVTLRGGEAVPLRILGSTDVSVRGVTATAKGADALTIAGSRDVTVEKCRFSRFDRTKLRGETQYVLIRDIESVSADQPLLRVGVLTDTHIRETRESCADVERAYRFFRAKGVDMIVNCGDFAHRFFPKGYAHYRAISRETYPDPATAPRELFVWAGHDSMGFPEGRELPPWPKAFAQAKQALGIGHELYEDLELRGFRFLVFPQEHDEARVREMLTRACAASAGRPVFVFDHIPASGTTECTVTDARLAHRKLYEEFPQVIVITGHTHACLRNELNLWQESFTTVSAGCFSDWDGCMLGTWRGATEIRNFVIMDVYPDRAVFRRYDLNDGPGEIGAERPWTVTWPFDPQRAADASRRRRAEVVRPAFPSNAVVTVRTLPKAGDVEVSFPKACTPETLCRYRIAVDRRQPDGAWRPWAVQDLPAEFILPSARRSRTLKDVLNGGLFAAGESYRVTVTPMGFFEEAGEPLVAEWKGEAEGAAEVIWEGLPEGVTAGKPVLQAHLQEVRFELPKEVCERMTRCRRVRVIADIGFRQAADTQLTFSLYGSETRDRYPWQVMVPRGDSDLRYAFDASLPDRPQTYSLAFRKGVDTLIDVKHVRIQADGPAKRECWVWLANGLKTDGDFDKATNILMRAAASGYNAMALAAGDGAYWRPERVPRMKRLVELARELDIEIIPHLWGMGYGGDLPWYVPEVVETTPAKGLRYRVKGRTASFVPDRITTGFEGRVVTNSLVLKLEKELKPFRTYRLSCRVRTEKVGPMNYHAVRGILWHDGRKAHELYDFPVKETQDWKAYQWEFNTYESARIDISVNRDRRMTGTAFIDSIAIEERPLTRCLTVEDWAKPVVRSAASGVVYAEGRDYEPIPKMKNPRYVEKGFDITILPGGAIKDGEELLVDANVPAVQGASQYFLCPTAKGIREYWLKIAKDVDALVHPRRWFFGTDEVRVANRCARCRARHVSPGRLMGEFTAMMAEVVREVNPKAEVCCWADMLCPLENAGRNPYYCVDGSLADSWEYVPKDMIMVPWMNGRNDVETTNWLMERGFRCIAGGYYNYKDFSRDIKWRDGCKGNPKFLGMMFTSWGGVWADGGYYDLEAYGKMVHEKCEDKEKRPWCAKRSLAGLVE